MRLAGSAQLLGGVAVAAAIAASGPAQGLDLRTLFNRAGATTGTVPPPAAAVPSGRRSGAANPAPPATR